MTSRQTESGSLILIVEDEALIAMEIEARVKSLGYSVLGPAWNLASASELLASATPHAALLDVQLANERATPIARRLRGLGVPYALVTGYARLSLKEEEFNDVRRISKPVTQRDLEKALNEMLMEAR